MALVEKPGDPEASSVVLETTPRVREFHPKWTVHALAPGSIQETGEDIRLDYACTWRISGIFAQHCGRFTRSTNFEVFRAAGRIQTTCLDRAAEPAIVTPDR